MFDPKLLKKAQQEALKLQERLKKAQEQLAQEEVEATAGGGAVRVVITGDLKVKSIRIDPEIVDPSDVEGLEDLILAAVNQAIEKAQALAAERLGAVTGNLKIPGLGF
jgi:DNA-binding YbaB/EbfC family protein